MAERNGLVICKIYHGKMYYDRTRSCNDLPDPLGSLQGPLQLLLFWTLQRRLQPYEFHNPNSSFPFAIRASCLLLQSPQRFGVLRLLRSVTMRLPAHTAALPLATLALATLVSAGERLNLHHTEVGDTRRTCSLEVVDSGGGARLSSSCDVVIQGRSIAAPAHRHRDG